MNTCVETLNLVLYSMYDGMCVICCTYIIYMIFKYTSGTHVIYGNHIREIVNISSIDHNNLNIVTGYTFTIYI